MDAQNNQSTATTKPAFTRDATAPTPTLGSPSTNSNGTIQVTATANETGGSGVTSYEFQYKEAGGNWTRKEVVNSTASSYTYTYTGMGDGKTVYIRVLVTDGAGNTGKSAEDSSNGTSAVIPSANTAPVMQNVTYSSKGTNYITVQVMATDAQNDALTYTMYISTDGSNWTQKATSSSTSAGSTVTLTANGLSEYTYYYIKVRATETSTAQKYYNEKNCSTYPIRTYCPGNGKFCVPESCHLCNLRISFKPTRHRGNNLYCLHE